MKYVAPLTHDEAFKKRNNLASQKREINHINRLVNDGVQGVFHEENLGKKLS